MKTLFLCATFLVLTTIHDFEKDIVEAVSFLRKEKTTLSGLQQSSSLTPAYGREALAIVFPEMIRWSAFKDFFETKSLETLYVVGGKDAADFSIGYFQMKPSFVEALEKYVAEHAALEHCRYIVPMPKSDVECRLERVKRLKQFDWQLRYAYVYWSVAHDLFQGRSFKTPTERVRFYATAYNCGFTKPVKEIESWLTKRAFPYGAQYKGSQVVYADIAIEFLEKYAQEF